MKKVAENGHREVSWGANAVELEFMRYLPRPELTRALGEYDLVQVVAGGPAWALAASQCRVPVVLQVATLASWERRSQLTAAAAPLRAWRTAMTRVTSAAERSALRKVAAVLVENQVMLDRLDPLCQAPVYRAPPGVDTTVFSPSVRGWRADGHVLSVCRLGDPRKGLDRTVGAYAEMARRLPDVPRLVLAGRGGIQRTVSDLISSIGLSDRVFVCADVERGRLVELYRNASVFLQTSHEEGLGLSVLEAMSCGLPVVATETAGSRETIVHGATGWLVPQGPLPSVASAMADRAVELLGGSGEGFGLAARNRCLDTFATPVAIGRIICAYDTILSAATMPDREPKIECRASR
ncbi:MAG TPA: glycosyltransferase family 4 protein [Rugosimonospora sp.]|nr:glycosyltransferase family 4 protein [Rugosimonospora sp.]